MINNKILNIIVSLLFFAAMTCCGNKEVKKQDADEDGNAETDGDGDGDTPADVPADDSVTADSRDTQTDDGNGQTGVVRLYDTNKLYDYKHYGFDAYDDKDDWTLVPYGTDEGYVFNGDPVIEGESFWVDMKTQNEDSMFIYFKKPDGSGDPVDSHIENYRVYDTPNGLRNYGGGTNVPMVKVIKNTPEEIIVEHYTVPYERGGYETEIVTRFRVLAGMRWLEEIPVSQADELGAHGEARIGIFPEAGEGGEDIVCDAFLIKEEGWFPSNDETTKMLLDLKKHDGDIMYTMTWPPAPRSDYPEWAPSRARFDIAECGSTQGWTPPPDNPCPHPTWSYWTITSPFVQWADRKIVMGLLNHAGIFHFEEVDQVIHETEEYTSEWPTAYGGRWRLNARIDGNYYTSEVNVAAGQHLSFTSPVDGTLEYIVMYLYDRTDDTPPDITTPMDVYRESI